jgi:hypothetical protein
MVFPAGQGYNNSVIGELSCSNKHHKAFRAWMVLSPSRFVDIEGAMSCQCTAPGHDRKLNRREKGVDWERSLSLSLRSESENASQARMEKK